MCLLPSLGLQYTSVDEDRGQGKKALVSDWLDQEERVGDRRSRPFSLPNPQRKEEPSSQALSKLSEERGSRVGGQVSLTQASVKVEPNRNVTGKVSDSTPSRCELKGAGEPRPLPECRSGLKRAVCFSCQ